MGLSQAAVAAAVAVALTTSTASAAGTVNIHHFNGASDVYPGSVIAIVGKTLRVHSPDHRGTLVIERAACTHEGPILVCLPTSMLLRQHGVSRTIDLQTGTIYYNLTADPQQLPYTTRHLAPHGILMSLRTQRGTSINVDGTVDSGFGAR
jgi:hypothetical protein